jgi:hypothetical protein
MFSFERTFVSWIEYEMWVEYTETGEGVEYERGGFVAKVFS